MATDRTAVDTRPPLYVVLVTGTASNNAAVHGTGFIIDARGRVVTCRHVVFPGGAPLADLKVALPTERVPWSYQAVADSAEDDLAVLEPTVPLDGPVPQCLQYDECASRVEPGQAVTVWGYSAPENYTGAQRFDCSVSGFSGRYGRIGLAGSVNFGDSGGPVLDGTRNLVGIAQARDRTREGQAMAIPASLLYKLLRSRGLEPAVSPGRERVFQAPKQPAYALVGRAQLLQELKQQLANGRNLVLCFRPGVGKSALAIALAYDRQLAEQFDGVLWAGLKERPDVLSELRKWSVAVGVEQDKIEQLEHLAPCGASLEDASEQVEAWAQELTRAIGERRMLLVIDDAWDLEPAEAMLLPARNCAYIITTGERAKVAAALGPSFEVHEIDDLTAEDGVAFLRELAPAAVDACPEETARIVDAVGGLPQALVILGKELLKVSWHGQRELIQASVRALEETLDQKLEPVARAIKVSYDRLPGDAAREALQALSIFRPKPASFTLAAARAVLGSPVEPLNTLLNAGLVETCKTGDDPTDLPYTMHRTIADFARARLDDSRRQQLHRQAADHFADWLKRYEDPEHEPGRYGHQYRYENPQWQDAMDDFLYHLARAGDPASAMVQFATIYFSAFWWWGCYAPFPFCSRLLQQAASKRLAPQARHSVDLLLAFDAAYPKESLRDAQAGAREPHGDWAAVEKAIVEVRSLGALEGPPPETGVDAWRSTRMLTDIFLAEALRFGRAEYGQAERLYRDALEMLPEDDWSLPWVHYHLADLFLETGRLEQVLPHCAKCLALAGAPARKDQDNEVLANAWRVRAELAARTGDRGAVVEGLQRMVLHAYAFQAIPEPPDAYTVAFYRQITRRAAALLQQLHGADAALAQACCEALRAYWARYREVARADGPGEEQAAPAEPQGPEALKQLMEAQDTTALEAWLFPPAPSADDMHKPGSRYFNEVVILFNEMMAPS